MELAQLAVVCRPNARQSAVAGWVDSRLAVRVAAPAQDGKANQALLRLIAAVADVPPSTVSITHGAGGRLKLLELPLAGLRRLQATIPGYGS
jgi:uncharacterized protein YggU (UPF0235/DUF167 family)